MAIVQKVDLPEAKSGDWSIEYFERPPERFTGLRHVTRGFVMSDVPEEQRDLDPLIAHAKGRVLLNGLGIGLALATVLRCGVEHVTVIEKEPDVIALVLPHYRDARIGIVVADAFAFEPNGRYDAVWHDIWDDRQAAARASRQMAALRRKYAACADWQGFWSQPQLPSTAAAW